MPPRNRNNRKHASMGASLEMAQFLDAGANKIKKRIRDLERLLKKKKDILPDTVIIEKERTLQALKLELENAQLKQISKKNASKYHMVRFFERKKAMRRYNQTLKKIESDPDNAKELDDKLNDLKIDLCYIVNFPKTEKYIALYPSSNNNDNDDEEVENKESAKSDKRKQFIRDSIIQQIDDGSLPVSFNDIIKGRKLDKEHTGIDLQESKKKHSKKGSDKLSKKSDKTDVIEKKGESDHEDEEDDFFE